MVINMKLPKKLLAVLVAAMCAVLAAGGCNPQKTPDYGINPVALSVNGVDITLFDFDRFYTTNQKYYYLTHGAVDAQEYFETVLDEVVRYGVALSKAQELNIQLTAEDEDEVQNELQTQCDLTFEKYSKTLADNSSASAAPALDSKTVEAAFREDKGYSFAEYRGFLARFLRNKKIISKLYEEITADVAPDEEEIIAYIQLNVSEQSLDSFSTFVTRYKKFCERKRRCSVLCSGGLFHRRSAAASIQFRRKRKHCRTGCFRHAARLHLRHGFRNRFRNRFHPFGRSFL